MYSMWYKVKSHLGWVSEQSTWWFQADRWVSELEEGGCVGVQMLEGAENWLPGIWVAGLILCSSGCEVIYGSCVGHTSPSWLALLTPCHILVGLRNSLFLFELIRAKKKKRRKEKKKGKKKVSPWDLGESWGGGMWGGPGAAELRIPRHRGLCFCLVLSHREAFPIGVWLQLDQPDAGSVLVWRNCFGGCCVCCFVLWSGRGASEGVEKEENGWYSGREEIPWEGGIALAPGRKHSTHWLCCERSLRSSPCCTACILGMVPRWPLPFHV